MAISPTARLWTEKAAAAVLRSPPSSALSGSRNTEKLFETPCTSTTMRNEVASAIQRGSRTIAQ